MAEAKKNKQVKEGTISETDGLGNMTVEEAFEQLSEIVNQMSSSEVGLEESLQLYKQGVQLLDRCGKHLDRIEKEMITLTEEGNVPDEY